MKIYLVIDEWQYDSGENGLDIQAFKNYKNAEKELNAQMKMAIVDFKNVTDNCDVEATNVGENKHWSIFENGAYCYNHINIKLVTRYFVDGD